MEVLHLQNMLHTTLFCFFFSSDITIARSQTPKNILQLADEIGLLPSEVSAYGNKKAKVSLSVINRLKQQKDGKYIVCVG